MRPAVLSGKREAERCLKLWRALDLGKRLAT
jgi:hypothetical protein